MWRVVERLPAILLFARGAEQLHGAYHPATVGVMSDETSGPGADSILERYKWKKVLAPKTWLPKVPGTELVGFYAGRTMRQGSWGQYEVVLVLVPTKGAYMISGCQVIQLMDAAMVEAGHPVRIVYNGTQELTTQGVGESRRMKLFEVFVAEGEPIDAMEMPSVDVEVTQ